MSPKVMWVSGTLRENKTPPELPLPVPPIICRRDAAKQFPPQIPGALSTADGSRMRLPKVKRPTLHERLQRLVTRAVGLTAARKTA